MTDFAELKGKTLERITALDDQIDFWTVEDRQYRLFHSQDCCESVMVESIAGDLNDLLGSPILVAEEAESRENPPNAKPETIEWQDSFTWTFYKLATIKGSVDIRWYGESNGYYSESVDFVDMAA